MKFSKDDTLLMKGFAIIFLCCYHCFSDYSRLSGVDVNFFPLSQKTGIYISESLNLCVGMFAFLSVYGMTLTLKGKKIDLALSIKEKLQFVTGRYIGLIGGFLIPFFFCHIVSAILSYDPYGEGVVNHVCNFILDMLGVSKFFDTPLMTETWWYMSLAVLFIIVFPFVIDIYRKYSVLIIPLVAAFLLLAVDHIENMNRWLFIIPLGVCFADLDWFQKLYQWIRKNSKTSWIKRIVIYFLFLVVVYLRPHPWGLAHIPLIVNSVTSIFMIFILYDIFYTPSKLKRAFMFLGRHSANIFYIHTFIRDIWFNKLTYSFRYAALILLFVLITTLLISVILERFKYIIKWNEKIRSVKQLCCQKIKKCKIRG